jgi:hypothetical protein
MAVAAARRQQRTVVKSMALAEGHLLSLLGLLPTCFASIRFLVRGGGAMQDSRKHFIFFLWALQMALQVQAGFLVVSVWGSCG